MHPGETGDDDLGIGCTDCHGGDPAEATDKKKAHVEPRCPELWRSSATRCGSPRLNHESPSSSASSTRATCASPTSAAGPGLPPERGLGSKKSMMTHGCMLWGAALYNNGAFPIKHARYGESYSIGGVILQPFTNPPPSLEETREKGVVATLDRCRASRSRSRATSSASSSAAARSRLPGGRHPEPVRAGGPARGSSATAASAPRTAPTRSSSACRRRGCSTRRSTSSAPTTTPATTAPAAAPPATSSTPTTAPRSTPGRTPSTATWGSSQTGRPDHPEERAGPPDRAPVHQRHADQPVHGLPHPPRHDRHEQLPRHDGGTRRPTAS